MQDRGTKKYLTFQGCFRETSSYLVGHEVRGVPAQIHLMMKQTGVSEGVHMASFMLQKHAECVSVPLLMC